MSNLTCSPPIYASLPDRALLQVSGPEAVTFLNALVSNDVALQPGPDGLAPAAYAALLTPQGKFLHDFLIVTLNDGRLLLDMAAERRADLKRRLTLYRLRAKVEIVELDGWAGYALFGSGQMPAAPEGGVLFTDPRLPALGWRLWLPPGLQLDSVETDAPLVDASAYEQHRIALGVPDGARDIEVDKGLLLENHFEALHGVDFRKGCYIGQELTARTKYRGLLKKQLYRIEAQDPDKALPAIGTPVTVNGQEVGALRTSIDGQGLALLRLDAVDQPLDAAGVALRAHRPDYAGPVPDPKT